MTSLEEQAKQRYESMWNEGKFEWNHHDGDILGQKPVNPARIWNTFVLPLMMEMQRLAQKEKEEAFALGKEQGRLFKRDL